MFRHLEVAVQDYIESLVDIPVLRAGVEARVTKHDLYIALEVLHPIIDGTTISKDGPFTAVMDIRVVVKRDKNRDLADEYESVRKYSAQMIDLFHNDFEGLDFPYTVGTETGSYRADESDSVQQTYALDEEKDLTISILSFEMKLFKS